ncbi:MAG: VWA domain-containing protein [Candidatus Marinimicrobia bacterium]|nr:VWA domain-containing protein [Candidatus Neomarinimicrobiota bacterium]
MTVSQTDASNHFILVVDKSGSMDGEPIQNIKSALYHFIDDMKPDDKASLILFDHRISVENVFTSDKAQLKGSVKDFDAGGGTAIYDALGKASILAHENGGQSIIVFFTDGYDNSSKLSDRNISSITASQGVYVYGIALGEVNQQVLADIAQKTNGDFFYADNSVQLTNLYSKSLYNYYNIFDQKKLNTTRIVVKSHPSDRPVFINGDPTGQKTPVVIENLTPGSYEVVINFERGEWKCSANLNAGETGRIDARENDLGHDIAVISDVKSAMVFVDDAFAGYTSKYPFVAKTVREGWFKKTTKFNFDKQLIIENISRGAHEIKIIGLAEMENFFPPLETTIIIVNRDVIINAEFLSNRLESKKTEKILRNFKKDSPYDKVDDMFDELE